MKTPAFENTLRQSRAYGLLRKDIQAGLGHAYMIISPDDETVSELFTLVAAAVYCTSHTACMECTECHKVLTDNNPDVFSLNEAGEKIKVQEIKDLVSSVSIKPLSDRKIYFVHRADLMTADAQNKLLKTLEEPPAGVTIFLGVANEAGLLDTVKSRCRHVYLDVFDRNTVFQALSMLNCDEESAAIAAACSEGQLGKARRIALSPEYKEYYSDALELLEKLQRSPDVLKTDSLPCFKKNIGEFLKILSVAVRDLMTAKTDGELLFDSALSGRIRRLAEQFSLRALALIVQQINKAQEKLFFGVNQLAVTDSLLFSVLEVKHKWQS